jgi:hypothetical protein
MASASFRDSMTSLGWSRREEEAPVNTSSPSLLGRIQGLNPFGEGGYVRLPITETNPGAPLPAPTRREEEEGWFARKSTSSSVAKYADLPYASRLRYFAYPLYYTLSVLIPPTTISVARDVIRRRRAEASFTCTAIALCLSSCARFIIWEFSNEHSSSLGISSPQIWRSSGPTHQHPAAQRRPM